MTNSSSETAAPRLHLGCGQRYLDGYINIDFPLDNHSVQQHSVADRHADITTLVFPARSVAEVRLHHVFEHFRRPVACALLATWNAWMIDGATLHVEVPDLQRSAWVLANPFAPLAAKALTERHLFGSHEASWAAHFEAYSEQLLRHMFETFGFTVTQVTRNSWAGTHNLEVIAHKKADLPGDDACRMAARRYLETFLVDRSESEIILLDTWLAQFDSQLAHGR